MKLNNAEDYEAAIPYVKKFAALTLTLDEFKRAIHYKFFRICCFYHIKDADGKKCLFIPNLAQVEFYKAGHWKDLILKARQLGFTTWKMIIDLDSCLFIKNFSAGCIAHNDKAAKDIYQNKVRFAYRAIKPSIVKMLALSGYALPTPENDKDNGYRFSNGSTISVSTGYRGGTLQSLHISEFGKICKKYPERAEEIVTGAFPAASGKDSTITIESTAEGKEGYYYDYCQDAMYIQKLGTELFKEDYKFHFFPWWKDPKYQTESKIPTPTPLLKYFTDLEFKHGVKLTTEQIAWYCATWKVQGDKMKQEYPSTPDEAFSQALKGAYYANQFTKIYKEGRICKGFNNKDQPIYTAWDIGVGDSTSIWFYQKIGTEIHLIDYYENSGEGLAHYAKVLHDKRYNYARHYAPHDIDNRDFSGKGKTRREMAREGFEINGQRYSIIFEKVAKLSVDDGINYVRSMLDRCVFNEETCKRGIKCLEAYRKEWNDKLGCYRDKPLHDFASDAADAFRYLAVTEEGSRKAPTSGMTASR